MRVRRCPYALLLDRLQRIRSAVHDFRQNRNCVRSLGRRSLLVSHLPAELRVVSEAMREIDRDVLSELRSRADPIAFILPTAIEWVGWESMRIVDTEDGFSEHVLDLTGAGLDGALLMLLGMLGPHLRQQSDEIDRTMLPLLLGIALRRFQQSLGRRDMAAARSLAGIIFSALHFNPDYSLARDRARQHTPYDFAGYRSWFSRCLDDIHRTRPSLDALSLLQRSVVLFPSLLGDLGDQLPLPLQFADKCRGYMEQSGQDLLELLARHVERYEGSARTERCPTVWDFVSGDAHPVVQDFMRRRNHQIPSFQLDLLIRVRNNMVRGTLMEDERSFRL